MRHSPASRARRRQGWHRAPRRELAVDKVIFLPADLQLCDAVCSDAEALHRHGIEQFIAEHDAAEAGGREAFEPLYALQQMRRILREQRPLASAQCAADFKDEIVCRGLSQAFEFEQQLHGECAAAGTGLKDIAMG